MPKIGDTSHFDYQGDIYETPYRYVDDLGGGRWVIEIIEPTEATLAHLEEMEAYDNAYCNAAEALDRMLERVGERMEIRVVSRAAWAAMF